MRQLVDEIQRAGGQAVYQVVDVVNPSDNAEIVKLAKETFGGVDVIFLNSGIMPNSPLSALKTDEWNQIVNVNIKSEIFGSRDARPWLHDTAVDHGNLDKDFPNKQRKE